LRFDPDCCASDLAFSAHRDCGEDACGGTARRRRGVQAADCATIEPGAAESRAS